MQILSFHWNVFPCLSTKFQFFSRHADLDSSTHFGFIFAFQAKTSSMFEEWIGQLRHHRLYRQHELSYGTNSAPKLVDVNTPVDEYSPMTSPLSPGSPSTPLYFEDDDIVIRRFSISYESHKIWIFVPRRLLHPIIFFSRRLCDVEYN